MRVSLLNLVLNESAHGIDQFLEILLPRLPLLRHVGIEVL